MKVNTYLTDGFETVEALAVIDILRRAGITVDVVSVTGDLNVTSAQNVIVVADRLLNDESEEADVLFLPGGPGTASYKDVAGLKELFISQAYQEKGIAAICAAPSVLGEWGLLEGKNATAFPGFESKLIGAKVQKAPARVVIDGNILTARGMGTAVDLGLALVEYLQDESSAIDLGIELQYLEESKKELFK